MVNNKGMMFKSYSKLRYETISGNSYRGISYTVFHMVQFTQDLIRGTATVVFRPHAP